MKWILLIYKVPSNSSTARVTVWRKIKKIGALYLQQSVCITPYNEDFLKKVEMLKDEIYSMGGDLKSFISETTDDKMEKQIIQEFNKQRTEEYMEIKEQCEAYFDEIKMEIGRNNLTYAELEENEDELNKLHKWFDNVLKRDIFGAEIKNEVQLLLEKADEEFEMFASLVYDNYKKNE
ncbi:Chromate resistance protein ChrB [Thermoanaerobacterium sp. RBIITD]|uniref:Chromate resistance protein ChrB n=1 Tax=Thermoanaerobacterium sp. RBIITD TaxID=1550240 RepID=UPI000BB872AE|nr:Chromate resistance protein ChrB [Thermoanaerobacterium sp. RBIITD]SNX55606.1 hypothetical protein SAMN05660242_3437 [Thermoanaerobacterium sp. RBIITD]